jgi:WD40 repeat protein
MLVWQAGGGRGPLESLAFAPDGGRLAAICGDRGLRLWALPPGPREDALLAHAYAAAFMPDGRGLAVCRAGRVMLWVPGHDDQSEVLRQGHHWRVAVSADGRYIVASGGGVEILDRERRQRHWLTKARGELCGGLALAPGGRLLASGQSVWHWRKGTHEYSVRLAHFPSGGLVRQLVGHGSPSSSLAFRPDGGALAATCGPLLWVWDVAGGAVLARLKAGGRHFQAAAFTPDGRFLAAVNNDATARFWDARTWREARAFDWGVGSLTCLAFAPDGQRAAAGTRKGQIVVWDVDL